jgi:exodeoxyribonuclease VII large subunit
VVERRFPAQSLLLAPSRVQGAGAEDELVAALEALDAQPDVDVILLVRGGGSLEDLQPFNSERLARAIAACSTPLVSGVGHEVDVTIADLVADLRAATPSAAAAAALPDRERVAIRLDRDARRLVAAGRRAVERLRDRADAGAEALRLQAPRERLAARRGQLVATARALRREIRALLAARGAGMAAAAGRLETLSPLGVLARGYAIVQRRDDGAIVRRAGEVAVGGGLRVRLAEGELDARVEAVRSGSRPTPRGS